MNKSTGNRSSVEVAVRDGEVRYTPPSVCIQCGQEASVVHNGFIRSPRLPWPLYVLLGFLIPELLEVKAKMQFPFCKKHNPLAGAMPSFNFTDAHTASKVIAGILVMPFVLISAFVLGYAIWGDSKNRIEDGSIGAVFMAFGWAVGFGLIRLVKSLKFYPQTIDGSRIRLVGVSREFAGQFHQDQDATE